MKKITIGSDFSGVGAFNQALMRLGIAHNEIFACDMDKYARQTFIHNYGEPPYYPENVYDREIPKEPLDIYVSSPPCQSFSLAGKRLGEDDERGVLFYNSHEFIKQNNPRYFIFENVKGLLSDDAGKTFGRWVDMLGGKSVNGNPLIFPHEESVPYHIYWKVLNAKDYGVPQNRERVFIIGIRDDEDNTFTFPKEQHLTKRLKDVLEENVDEKYYLSDKAIAKCLKSIANADLDTKKLDEISRTLIAGYYKIPFDGQYIKTNEIKIKSATKQGFEIAREGDSINLSQPNSETRRGRVGKEVAQTLDTSCNQAVMIGAFIGRNPDNTSDRTTGAPMQQTLEINTKGTSNTITSVQKDNVVVELRNDEGIRYFKDGLCGTIRTIDAGRDKHVIENNYRIRKLTVRECFRLMDFPDSFTSPVSNSQAYKQAGNSIVVNVLAEIIKKLNLQ